jgi:2-polyprenyl-3-methyl-5-hydroxy-6-metoxy-1,4-benzoquinol methylase
MDKRLTVFTVVPEMYRLYPEFQLCLKMFREAFPDGTSLVEGKGNSHSLRELIIEHLTRSAPYILVVKEPAMLMKKGTVEELLRVLKKDADILCVLPSDTQGFREGRSISYYTLRGFERFTDALYEPKEWCKTYDGRSPWMFLMRRETLQRLSIPENPLDIPGRLPREKVCISLNAYIHPFVDYDLMTARTEVLPLVPEGISSLLDIGCYTGNFGMLVKEKLRCRVVGSEINPQAAAIAQKKLDLVIGDILTSEIAERFDCITCLDVVEHFVNTDLFLQKVRELLKDEGYLLLSVPNIGHWFIIEDLLAGRWDYMPAGTLCISHMRFFTRRSIESLLRDAQFKIVSVQEHKSPVPKEIEDAIGMLEQSGVEVDRKSLSCLGYYILAQKET